MASYVDEKFDYNEFSGMEEYEIRRKIGLAVCESDRLGSNYAHLDNPTLIAKFNEIAHGESRGVLVIASRPISNLNALAKAHDSIPIEKIVRTWDWWNYKMCDTAVKDQKALLEVKNTFNGPALLSNLLPPTDHLVGRFGHPSLQSGKSEAWKSVIGKLDGICSNLPECFFWKEYGCGTKANKREKERIDEVQKFIDNYIYSTVKSYENAKQYPGGIMELFQRCFSVYFVRFVRNNDNVLKGYKVRWLSDHTHSTKTGLWKKKSEKVTIPIAPYQVYLHDDGMNFAGWNIEQIKAQVAQHEKKNT